MEQPKPELLSADRLHNHLLWLLMGRPGAVLVLLATAYALRHVVKPDAVEKLLDTAVWVIVVTLALTLIYALISYLSKQNRWHAYVQMMGDIALVTWLVHLTDAVRSPLIALYLIIIFTISCLTSKYGTYALTMLITACYVGLVVQVHERYPGNVSEHQTAIGFYVFAFFAVAFLSSQFNEQLSRTDANLALANRKLNDIRAFSERVIDSISSGLVTINLQHQILSFNRAAEEITGFRATQVIGQHLNVLFPTISDQIDASKDVLLGGHGLSRLNLDCATAEGKQIQLGFSISPLTTVRGEITGFVLPFQDLTDVMRLERDVRRQDRLAALGRAAAGIAHEIRNPLASMRGAVQVLGSDSRLSDEEAQLMNIVLRESDRIDRIISDFLMYARPRQPEKEPVNLNHLLEETLTLLRYNSEIDSSKYQLRAVPCDDPALIFADPGQMRQVLWNLARNAVKAMPDGGEFTIAIQRSSDGSQIQVDFTDTGVGMTEEQIERIFEPFSSFSTGGTGLGMSVVYHIVNEHRGKIDVKSKVAEGTTITLLFAAYAETYAEEKAVSVAFA
ncbi:MAG TPA: ATP-binding protein [Blastocatellia bacterium]|nr:ATP-binding protein [Blastocatellia bacterium]